MKTFILLILVFVINAANAGDVEIVNAKLTKQGNYWKADVTLKHNDTGWEHYADNWTIVDENGNVLGDRVLYHPHVNEQPFTRSLSNIKISDDITTVYIRAHDKVHGWAKKKYIVELNNR